MSRRRTTRSPHRAIKPRGTARLAALLACVFAVKLIVLTQIGDHPLLQPDAGLDTSAYVQLARRVLAGDATLGPGLYYLSPLYIYFLAAALALGDSFTAVRVIQIVLGTAAVGCIFVSARCWYGERAAWWSATLAALTGVFTFYEIVLFQSSLDPFLTAAALACLAVGLQRKPDQTPSRGPGAVVAAGILFGAEILNRPNAVMAVAGLMVALLVVRRPRSALWMTAGVLAALTPVVARNLAVSHQLALTSSQGGLNFYIGNNAAATGQYAAVPGVRANIEGQAEDTRTVAERAVGHPLSDAEVSSYFTGLGVGWIRAHPAASARLFVKKLALVFNARHQWLDLSYPYYAHDAGSILGFLFVGPWLLVPLGLAGLLAAAPAADRAAYVAWASFAPLYAAAVALFFVAERYRLPLFVPLCIGAGAAIDRAMDLLRHPGPEPRTLRRVALPIFVFSMGVILTAWPFQLPDGRFQERLRLSKVLMNRGEYARAASELESALALAPGDAVTEFNLGMALVSSERPQEGVEHVRRAVQAGVPIAGARYALANVLLRTGDRDRAVSLLRTFVPQADDSAESCYHLALLALEAGEPIVAERYLKRALELRPGWQEAEQALSEATSRRPR